MALFCLKCFNKIKGTNYTYEDVECYMDICEECGTNDYCVVGIINSDED